MQKLALALSCCAALASCDETLNKAPADLAMTPPDLAPGADLAMHTIQPLTCGTQTCTSGQICCVTANAGGTAAVSMCAAPGTCADGGVSEMCGGPQNCATGSACCVTIGFMMSTVDGGMPTPTGGAATCTASCMVGLDLANNSIQTALCQTKSDCTGLSGSVFGTSVMFDGCCSRAGTPGINFCAPTAFNGRAGLVCP